MGSIKRQSINNGVSTSTNKNVKRYGSVPKHLLKSNSKFYKIYKNQANENSFIIKPQKDIMDLNNSFPSIKKTNSGSSSGALNYPLASSQPNKSQKKNVNIHKNHTVSKRFQSQKRKNPGIFIILNALEERSMSPLVNSQKNTNELYDNYSRITSYDPNNGQFRKQGNTTNNMNLINTLNKSTLSNKQSKKIFHSLGTLGIHAPPSNIITECENIEEMHGVLVTFLQISHKILDKVEVKQDKEDKEEGKEKEEDQENLLIL